MRLVRQADESDFERILEIEKAAFAVKGSMRAQVKEHLQTFPTGLFVDWKSRGYLLCTLVEKNHDLFDTTHCTGAEYVYITSVAVHPLHQGKGIGSRLIGAALEQFNLPGLLCVAPSNVGAIKLYQSLGFRKCGTAYRFFYDGTDVFNGHVMRQPKKKETK